MEETSDFWTLIAEMHAREAAEARSRGLVREERAIVDLLKDNYPGLTQQERVALVTAANKLNDEEDRATALTALATVLPAMVGERSRFFDYMYRLDARPRGHVMHCAAIRADCMSDDEFTLFLTQAQTDSAVGGRLLAGMALRVPWMSYHRRSALLSATNDLKDERDQASVLANLALTISSMDKERHLFFNAVYQLKDKEVRAPVMERAATRADSMTAEELKTFLEKASAVAGKDGPSHLLATMAARFPWMSEEQRSAWLSAVSALKYKKDRTAILAARDAAMTAEQAPSASCISETGRSIKPKRVGPP
jgi:hypothetical protein